LRSDNTLPLEGTHPYCMKRTLTIALFTLLCSAAYAQAERPKYDKALADSLGADDYGMKSYVLVILKTGSNKVADKAVLDSLFRGHMNNINRLADNGKLVVAGPLGKNDKTYRGIFILNAKTVAEANELLQTDPAVQSKLLDAEVYQWYGSAALPLYLQYHDKIEKQQP
jgi:YCII-related domain.